MTVQPLDAYTLPETCILHVSNEYAIPVLGNVMLLSLSCAKFVVCVYMAFLDCMWHSHSEQRIVVFVSVSGIMKVLSLTYVERTGEYRTS